MRTHTGENHIIVLTVISLSQRKLPLQNISEYTLVKNHINAVSVVRPLHIVVIL